LTGKYPIEHEPVNPLIILRTDVFRSNKISLASANDIIDSLMESSEIMSGTGAVVITQKNGRKTTNTGTIYLRDGLIYAALIENHKIPIGKRIETGALVRDEDLNEVFSKVGGDTTSPRIIDYLLQNHMISEKILSSYVKEHFIETLGKIMSWNDSLGEWHPNAVTKDFVMPFVTFERIRDILSHRKHVYGEFLRLTEKFMRPEELPELTFSLLKAPTTPPSPTTLKIISLCDKKNTIDDISAATGVTFYNVFQTIIGLWRNGFLSLNIGGIRLPYTSVLVEPEPEPEPIRVELINPPIPVYEEAAENAENLDTAESDLPEKDFPVETGEIHDYTPEIGDDQPVDSGEDVVDPVADGEGFLSAAADYTTQNDIEFQHFTQETDLEDDDAAESAAAIYDPLKDADKNQGINSDSNPTEKPSVLHKDILDRRNKVDEINNKLNQLESNLAACEQNLRDNQITLGTLEERKTWLERELADVEIDYNRTISEKDEIKKSYELIRKEVEDTINSFTFIEGE
jgi:hypothetical protein